jgi:3-oxoacyl-[acyl-carrier protein] reductase
MIMDIRLNGRVAVITGGSKGLGLAMATRFAESGADVAILARDPAGLAAAEATIGSSAAGKVLAVACDITQPDDIKRAYAEIESKLGHVDIVVNNAGSSKTGPFESLTDEVLQDDLELKLFGAVRLTRLAWPGMKARKWGRVINVLAIAAKTPRPNSAPTAISRAAGMALTKILAGEGAPHGILVNALLVGQIVSEQVKKRYAASGSNGSIEDFIVEMGKNTPLGRMGKAQEFADLACFLASENAGFVTGTAINVDGGASYAV